MPDDEYQKKSNESSNLYRNNHHNNGIICGEKKKKPFSFVWIKCNPVNIFSRVLIKKKYNTPSGEKKEIKFPRRLCSYEQNVYDLIYLEMRQGSLTSFKSFPKKLKILVHFIWYLANNC